jgi:hypothetical protein
MAKPDLQNDINKPVESLSSDDSNKNSLNSHENQPTQTTKNIVSAHSTESAIVESPTEWWIGYVSVAIGVFLGRLYQQFSKKSPKEKTKPT